MLLRGERGLGVAVPPRETVPPEDPALPPTDEDCEPPVAGPPVCCTGRGTGVGAGAGTDVATGGRGAGGVGGRAGGFGGGGSGGRGGSGGS